MARYRYETAVKSFYALAWSVSIITCVTHWWGGMCAFFLTSSCVCLCDQIEIINKCVKMMTPRFFSALLHTHVNDQRPDFFRLICLWSWGRVMEKLKRHGTEILEFKRVNSGEICKCFMTGHNSAVCGMPGWILDVYIFDRNSVYTLSVTRNYFEPITFAILRLKRLE